MCNSITPPLICFNYRSSNTSSKWRAKSSRGHWPTYHDALISSVSLASTVGTLWESLSRPRRDDSFSSRRRPAVSLTGARRHRRTAAPNTAGLLRRNTAACVGHSRWCPTNRCRSCHLSLSGIPGIWGWRTWLFSGKYPRPPVVNKRSVRQLEKIYNTNMDTDICV